MSDETYKITLVGESGVGKSSIINYFINKKFDNLIIPTNNVGYSSKTLEINGRKIKLDIWDTAGQEKYRSLTKIFYSNSQGVIIVYDITNHESFEEIKNYWYKVIQEKCPDINKFNFN